MDDDTKVHLEYISKAVDRIEKKFETVDANEKGLSRIKFYFKSVSVIFTGLWGLLIAWISNKNH